MNAPKDSQELLPKSPLDVLESTAREISSLEKEAQRALGSKDPNEYKRVLHTKAEIMVNLPTKLDDLLQRGIPVPDGIIDQSANFAVMARKFLGTDNYFGMGVLLIPKGLKTGEPNDLEKLIDQLKNPE